MRQARRRNHGHPMSTIPGGDNPRRSRKDNQAIGTVPVKQGAQVVAEMLEAIGIACAHGRGEGADPAEEILGIAHRIFTLTGRRAVRRGISQLALVRAFAVA